jgi:hypothetical protein
VLGVLPGRGRDAPEPAAETDGAPAVALAVFFVLMEEPDYLICLQCETPTYQFEYNNGKLTSVVCNTCGADDVSDFVTESEMEEQGG